MSSRPVGVALALTCIASCAPKHLPVPEGAQPAAVVDAGVAIDLEDPIQCMGCHPAVVVEWQQSMHAHAHHSADPLYGAMREFRIAREGPAIASRCASCHTPRTAASPDAPAGTRGVSCATCHHLASVHPGQSGAAALERPHDAMLRGPHDLDAGTTAAHLTGARLEALADGSTVCLACHAEERNKAGVPTCSTGLEVASTQETRSCVSCHMPEVAAPSGPQATRATHRAHVFAGPHRAWEQNDTALLSSALAVSGRFERDGVVLTLKNQSAHAFPTGFPGRMAMLVLKGFDRSGRELWRNLRSEPLKEHPEAVLNMAYAGADGGMVLPPYGVRLARDSRLKPAESRELRVAVPPGVTRLEVSLRFLLIAPPAAATLGVAALPEARPVELPSIAVLER